MENSTSSKSKPLFIFFLLTFIFALPIYILVGLAANNIIFSSDMAFAFVPLATLVPISAALILTFRENGWEEAKGFLKRSFDYKRITNKAWYLPALFLLPVLLLLAWGLTLLIGQPLMPAQFPVVALPVVFIMFFILALGEEVGWLGYAFEPMLDKWSAFKAALVLGLIWALWHLPIYIFLIVDPLLITAQFLSLIAVRFLLVWLFNNTGKSVFVTIIFHALYNVTVAMLPVNLVIASILLIIAATAVIILWGSETMAIFRGKKA